MKTSTVKSSKSKPVVTFNARPKLKRGQHNKRFTLHVSPNRIGFDQVIPPAKSVFPSVVRGNIAHGIVVITSEKVKTVRDVMYRRGGFLTIVRPGPSSDHQNVADVLIEIYDHPLIRSINKEQCVAMSASSSAARGQNGGNRREYRDREYIFRSEKITYGKRFTTPVNSIDTVFHPSHYQLFPVDPNGLFHLQLGPQTISARDIINPRIMAMYVPRNDRALMTSVMCAMNHMIPHINDTLKDRQFDVRFGPRDVERIGNAIVADMFN